MPLASLVLLSACASPTAGDDRAQPAASQGAPVGRKVLTLGVGQEPVAFVLSTGTGGIGANAHAALEVRARWEGSGNQVIARPFASMRNLEIQQRPELAEPRDGMTNRLVRQALYYGLDRAAVAETVSGGLAPLADSWISPTDYIRPLIESSIPQYPYDPGRAQSLLSQTPWTRGPDGVLVHRETGERFRLMIYGTPVSLQEQQVVADEWKALGVEANIQTVPQAQDNQQTRSTLPGVGFATVPGRAYYTGWLYTKDISTAARGWSGVNRSGYSNPRFDALGDRFLSTVDVDERARIQGQLIAEGMGDVAIMPVFWPVRTVLSLSRVRGIWEPNTANILEWDVSPA